jgi:hypothetical protein
MKDLIENPFIARWRSYKEFISNGVVKLHSSDFFQEISIDTNRLLTLTLYKNNRAQQLIETDGWVIELLKNKHYLKCTDKFYHYEVISVNHFAMVLLDLSTQNKLFFAKDEAWQDRLNTNGKVVL